MIKFNAVMKKVRQLIITLLIASGATFFASCGHTENEAAVTEVQSIELLRTSQSWNDMELPEYPQGKPEIVAVKYIIPPGAKLNWHHHVSMNHGILVQGELTIIGKDGATTTIKEGEAVIEMVDAIHRGENKGTKPVILYMFYLSQKDLPLSVPYTETK